VDHQVLLVDDDASLRWVLRANLEKRGLVVREAASCESAVDALAETRPDVLILDLNLPGGSSGDVMRELRRRGIAAYTVVMSAGLVRPGFLTEFHPLAFLAKPFRIEDFLALVRHATGSVAEDTSVRDSVSEQETQGTTVLGRWLRELRATCRMLARTSPQMMRSVTLTLPLPRDEGFAPSAIRLADAIAEEYNLTAHAEIRQGLLRVHLTKTPDVLDQASEVTQ
jgi:DNA-binding NtrC family response regulator